MTGFVLAALALAVLAALFLGLPLLRRRPDSPSASVTAAVAALALIAASALVYSRIGDRAWSRLEGADNGNSTIAALARHLESDPQDQSGWIGLGGAYAGIGQFDLALRAFERANRLSPGGDATALAGMGEAMLLSGDGSRAQQAAEFI